MEYVVAERNLARNTQQSYRDAIRLLVAFAAAKTHKKVDELLIPDIDANPLRAILRHIEEKRKCSISSRNQRLAAIHALASFVAERCPEYLDWSAQLRVVKSKRSAPMPVCYLEKPEIDALLDAPNPVTKLGFRDHALLLFLYNSGARADEAAKVCIEDLSLHCGADGTLSSVCLHGKGGKVRMCPLWDSTTVIPKNLVAGRNGKERVFLNRRSEPLTRFGIHEIVTRYARAALSRMPEMRNKRISPHTIRHTTATHLLRAGVDIDTIRAWLGHVSINTTNIYAETDLETKAKALGLCAAGGCDGSPASTTWTATNCSAPSWLNRFFQAKNCGAETPRSRQNAATLCPLRFCSETSPLHFVHVSRPRFRTSPQCAIQRTITRWGSRSAHGIRPSLNRCLYVAPRRDTRYTLTAGGADGKRATESLEIKVRR
jgi:site-specific recombinase XerD